MCIRGRGKGKGGGKGKGKGGSKGKGKGKGASKGRGKGKGGGIVSQFVISVLYCWIVSPTFEKLNRLTSSALPSTSDTVLLL